MTTEATTTSDQDRLEKVALHIFSAMPAQANGQRCAHIAFQRAAAFVEQADRVRVHGIEAVVPTQEMKVLDDACYPNLPIHHPLNQQSRQFGSLEKVAMLKRIAANPEAHGMKPESEDHKLIRGVVDMCERRLGRAIEA